jgi:hypothetical protein
MNKKPRVLFVTYGGGHVSMVVPVMQAMAEQGFMEGTVLALTSAAATTRAAGLPTLQFRDFTQVGDAAALAWGSELASTIDPGGRVDAEETRAYLGLSFQDLVTAHGLDRGQAMYAQYGRHCFLPVPTMRRIVRAVMPDAIVITNSPRAERAAGLVARELGIPALCVNSMFAIDEMAWLGNPMFCDRICVLNEGVRDRFIAAGRRPEQVVVTGNPAFDALAAPALKAAGARLRQQFPVDTRQVLLWASQPEYESHPTAPDLIGDPELPKRILAKMLYWAGAAPGRHLIVRPHPNEHIDNPNLPFATLVPPSQCSVAVALHASDAVATITSTVALEGHAIGLPVLQVRGSIFDHSMPLHSMGLARECCLDQVPQALDELFANNAALGAKRAIHELGTASHKVLAQILSLLGGSPRWRGR